MGWFNEGTGRDGVVQRRDRERWGGSTKGPGPAETVTTFIDPGVSGSHERRRFGFSLHSGMSSAAKDLPVRSPL